MVRFTSSIWKKTRYWLSWNLRFSTAEEKDNDSSNHRKKMKVFSSISFGLSSHPQITCLVKVSFLQRLWGHHREMRVWEVKLQQEVDQEISKTLMELACYTKKDYFLHIDLHCSLCSQCLCAIGKYVHLFKLLHKGNKELS